MDWTLFAVFGVVLVPLAVMAAFLLRGKGAFMLAGYNTMRPEKKALYDEKALCRAAGWLLLAVSACLALVPIGLHFDILWMPFASVILVLGITVGFIIYANTGKRFLKADAEAPARSAVKAVTGSIALTVVTLACIGCVIFIGTNEPVVNVLEDSIEIKGMYGADIKFSAISEIALLEQSMREIGVARRTNGFGGFGDTLKGHFTLENGAPALLFVRSGASPLIRIRQNEGKDIYLSFRDSETTRALYDETRGSWQP